MQNIEGVNSKNKRFKVSDLNRISFFIGITIVLICCKTDIYNDFKSKGKITGPDLRMCICCGGWQIVIDGETYNFESLPGTSDINLQKETFPVLVKLDWHLSETMGCPKWIDIQRIIRD